MRIPTKKAILVAIGLSVVVVGSISVWLGDRCDTGALPIYGSLDGPVYESVEELTEGADLIVVGTVTGWYKGKRCATVDFVESIKYKIVGINADPIIFTEVKVSETLKGEAGAVITLGGYDAQRFVADNLTFLDTREEVLLFLSGPVPTDKPRYRLSPGTSTPDMYYNSLGNDNGVFEIYGGGRVIIPRMPELFDLDKVPEDLAGIRLHVQEIVSSSA